MLLSIFFSPLTSNDFFEKVFSIIAPNATKIHMTRYEARAVKPKTVGTPFGIANGKSQIKNLRAANACKIRF